jgi:lysozyme
MDRQLLESQLKRHEGLRLRPYRDTVGKLTIGYGRNLHDVGISQAEAEHLLQNDIDAVEQMLERVDGYQSLSPVRQSVIANMCFNLGMTRLQGFRKMWSAIRRADYATAAKEMLLSKWASQVGGRSAELAEMMRSGQTGNG